MAKRPNTQRGFRAPDEGVLPAPPAEPTAIPFSVETLSITGSPDVLTGPYWQLEIWTANRVYYVSQAQICGRVVDRVTGMEIGDHATLGETLMGGQLRDASGKITHVSQPYPRPGMAAIFVRRIEKRYRVSETSPVERVLLRERLVAVGGVNHVAWLQEE